MRWNQPIFESFSVLEIRQCLLTNRALQVKLTFSKFKKVPFSFLLTFFLSYNFEHRLKEERYGGFKYR